MADYTVINTLYLLSSKNSICIWTGFVRVCQTDNNRQMKKSNKTT